MKRKYPIGAEVLPTGVHFRVWAPHRITVAVVLEKGPGAGRCEPLAREPSGYFSGLVAAAGAGTCYRFRLDGDPILYPDPASRFQPEGPHGPSQVVDPACFPWRDAQWSGVQLAGQVFYELHVGTFTQQGTFAAARGELRELAALGVTCIELMPLADFSGAFGWGYDGVNLYAPSRLYGQPDDLRRFIEEAHACGLAVILDVVYNHLGSDGNYLRAFSPEYFSTRHRCDWGEAINFDGQSCGPVREYFLTNAACWIEEYHFDGLRLDATHQLFDASPEPIVAALVRRVRAAAGARRTLVIAENEEQDAALVRTQGVDALWNDDFHHSAYVALTGRNEGYCSDYVGRPQELCSLAKYGFLYQGQRSKWHGRRLGTPALDLPPAAFVIHLQNHDQIANASHGERLHKMCSPASLRAMTALLLLGPGTPLLFQGQEFAASAPFVYFADNPPKLAELVRQGRAQLLARFHSLAPIPDPADPNTMRQCKLDFGERLTNTRVYALHRDLLRLRQQDPVLRIERRGAVDAAVLGEGALVLRYFGGDGDDRLLLLNFGVDLHLDPAPEPLLAPPAHTRWALEWSSEDPAYGGSGTYPLEGEVNWRLPGQVAVLLRSRPTASD